MIYTMTVFFLATTSIILAACSTWLVMLLDSYKAENEDLGRRILQLEADYKHSANLVKEHSKTINKKNTEIAQYQAIFLNVKELVE